MHIQMLMCGVDSGLRSETDKVAVFIVMKRTHMLMVNLPGFLPFIPVRHVCSLTELFVGVNNKAVVTIVCGGRR